MAANRLTQTALLALTENPNANARLSQTALLALTENTNANARVSQIFMMVLTDPPSVPTARRIFCQVIG